MRFLRLNSLIYKPQTYQLLLVIHPPPSPKKQIFCSTKTNLHFYTLGEQNERVLVQLCGWRISKHSDIQALLFKLLCHCTKASSLQIKKL